MRTTTVARLVVLGAVLPLLMGATIGNLTTEAGKDTWAYPMQPTAFLLLSIGLAISHALIALSYRQISNPWATLALAGSVALAVCELVSGLMAKTDLDSRALTTLDAGYAVASIAVLIGTLAAGTALRRTGDRLATPLLLNGALLLIAIVCRFLISDGLGIAALTVWSLSYVWLGLRLGVRQRSQAPAQVRA